MDICETKAKYIINFELKFRLQSSHLYHKPYKTEIPLSVLCYMTINLHSTFCHPFEYDVLIIRELLDMNYVVQGVDVYTQVVYLNFPCIEVDS